MSIKIWFFWVCQKQQKNRAVKAKQKHNKNEQKEGKTWEASAF